MRKFYAAEAPRVNIESRALEHSPVHHEAPGPLLDGSLGEGLSSFQAPRPPCTRPYVASPLSKP